MNKDLGEGRKSKNALKRVKQYVDEKMISSKDDQVYRDIHYNLLDDYTARFLAVTAYRLGLRDAMEDRPTEGKGDA